MLGAKTLGAQCWGTMLGTHFWGTMLEAKLWGSWSPKSVVSALVNCYCQNNKLHVYLEVKLGL